MYLEPQTRHISFSSTATACAVVAPAFAQVERGFGTIFEQLCVYIYQKIYGMLGGDMMGKTGGYDTVKVYIYDDTSEQYC